MFFYNLLVAVLIGYEVIPMIAHKNYYQLFGHNQKISVDVNPTETSTYVSRLIVYRENSINDIRAGQTAVFNDIIAGESMVCDGPVATAADGSGSILVRNNIGVEHWISSDYFLGTYVRISNVADRIGYFNFQIGWRFLTDVNIGVILYVAFIVFQRDPTKSVTIETAD